MPALTAAEAVRNAAKIIAAAHSAATIHFAHAETLRTQSHKPRQYRKPTLLPVVEALKKGRQRVGEALQSGATRTQGIGLALQPLNRISGRLLVVRSGKPVHPHLGEITPCLLEGWPDLF